MFDEKQYLDSLVAPEYRARDGKTFVGAILSADEVAPLEAKLRGAGKSWAKTQEAMQAVVEACFPRSEWARLWQVHPVWRYIRKLPPPGQIKAVWDFIAAQLTALGIPTPASVGPIVSRISQEVKDVPPTAGS